MAAKPVFIFFGGKGHKSPPAFQDIFQMLLHVGIRLILIFLLSYLSPGNPVSIYVSGVRNVSNKWSKMLPMFLFPMCQQSKMS